MAGLVLDMVGIFTLAARTLDAAGMATAQDFATVAGLVAAGTPLDQLPIGHEIVARTLEARLDALEDDDWDEEDGGLAGLPTVDALALDVALVAQGARRRLARRFPDGDGRGAEGAAPPARRRSPARR